MRRNKKIKGGARPRKDGAPYKESSDLLILLGVFLFGAALIIWPATERAYGDVLVMLGAAAPVAVLIAGRRLPTVSPMPPLVIAMSMIGWAFYAGAGGDHRWRTAAVLLGGVMWLIVAGVQAARRGR